jgi:hypothetical protein
MYMHLHYQPPGIFLTVPQTSERLLLLGACCIQLLLFILSHGTLHMTWGAKITCHRYSAGSFDGEVCISFTYGTCISEGTSLSHLILIFVSYLYLLIFPLKFLTNWTHFLVFTPTHNLYTIQPIISQCKYCNVTVENYKSGYTINHTHTASNGNM